MRRFNLVKVAGIIMLVGFITAVVLPVLAQEQDPGKEARKTRYRHIQNWGTQGQLADGTPFQYQKKGEIETITITYPNEEIVIKARLTSGGNLDYVKVTQIPPGMTAGKHPGITAGEDHLGRLDYDLATIGRDEAKNLIKEGKELYQQVLQHLRFDNPYDIENFFEKERQTRKPEPE